MGKQFKLVRAGARYCLLGCLLMLGAITLGLTYPKILPAATYTAQVNPYTGSFTDDYGIKYTITDSLWIQQPRTKFHIIKWNLTEQYLIARNDVKNPGDGGLYTRIDFMQFSNMAPWNWGYCLTAYNAATDKDAEAIAIADRKNPKKGCNGYPFSRMKLIE